jgi:hypothetical protein
MKSKLWIQTYGLPCLLLLVIFSCSKIDNTDRNTAVDAEKPVAADYTLTAGFTKCFNAPDYGDSIIFLQPVNGNYTIQPVNNKGVQGIYLSWPEGLKIDSSTGVMTVSQSETGLRYNIGFVKNGTTDTCVSKLILGGVSYIDSIHVLGDHDTLAVPIFNADPYAASICGASDDTDYPDNNNKGNNKCKFDDDSTGQQANAQKLRVRTVSGVINLKKSMADGLFGPNVKNGESKVIKIQYRLNDGSKMAKQKVNVQVMYYDKVSNIPAALQKEVTTKRNYTLDYHIVNGKPRPPLIIIAGFRN